MLQQALSRATYLSSSATQAFLVQDNLLCERNELERCAKPILQMRDELAYFFRDTSTRHSNVVVYVVPYTGAPLYVDVRCRGSGPHPTLPTVEEVSETHVTFGFRGHTVRYNVTNMSLLNFLLCDLLHEERIVAVPTEHDAGAYHVVESQEEEESQHSQEDGSQAIFEPGHDSASPIPARGASNQNDETQPESGSETEQSEQESTQGETATQPSNKRQRSRDDMFPTGTQEL